MSQWTVYTLPGLLHSQAALQNSYPDECVPRSEAVCTIFMKVFEQITYRTRGRHAKH